MAFSFLLKTKHPFFEVPPHLILDHLTHTQSSTSLSQKEEKRNIRPSHAPDKGSAFSCRLEVGSPLLRFLWKSKKRQRTSFTS
jgi:hypothetical protein